MTATEVIVLAFGGRRPPRVLASLRSVRIDDATKNSVTIDEAVHDARRVIVLGTDLDLAAVLTRLMRNDLLEVEVGHARGWRATRRALRAPAHRVPLIRDDTGTVLVGSALWLPPEGASAIHGEVVVDDTVLFDGDVAAVRIEPTSAMPGLRAAVLGGSRRRWVSGRATQLGTTGARVIRDGVEGPRTVKRSSFYRNTTGWLRVG